MGDNWKYDKNLVLQHRLIIGVDEAGRGPLAGNVVAAAVVLNLEEPFDGINDSKKLSEKKREKLFTIIKKQALFWGIGEATCTEIDKVNILQATFLAMKRAIQSAGCTQGLVLVDGNHNIPNLDRKQQCLIKGDALSASVAAASILAKVTRDRQMKKLHSKYPQYNFEKNKGYGTAEHIKALKKHGPTPFHRRSFQPVSIFQTTLF
ncbi:MAG: ribonuclease HII [Fibrobacteria bacterium]|nr:ribonuclease HII [Fibrobacteria bacterium]